MAKVIGGVCILGASYLFGYNDGSKHVSVDKNISKYLAKVEDCSRGGVNLKGDVKILKSIKGKVVLSIDDKVRIEIMEEVNNVYDSNVDLVNIFGEKDLRVIKFYTNNNLFPFYKFMNSASGEFEKKMSLEDQIFWNAIYNSLVNKDPKVSHMIHHHPG